MAGGDCSDLSGNHGLHPGRVHELGGEGHLGIIGDPVVSGLTNGLSTCLALEIKNPFLQSLAYNTSQYILLEAAQLIFDGLGGVTSGNTVGFSIAQLKVSKKLCSKTIFVSF